MKRFFDSERKRLLWVGRRSDRAMWDERWEQEEIEKLFSHEKLNFADRMVVDATRRYLSEGSRILEGGCGLGNNVELLRRSGYRVIGVDYAEKTVERLKRFKPDLEVRCGDLRELSFEDGYFDGYWSFGVIEHFYDGFAPIASEMRRVVRPGGYLFVTVPALSRLRMLKARLGMFPEALRDDYTAGNFYQYAFGADEIVESFHRIGFTLAESRGWGVYKGVSDEIPGSRLVMSALCRLSETAAEGILGGGCNHMHLFIFRKGSGGGA